MGWPELLQDMTARLAASRRLLREGGPPPAPLVLPADLDPLPADLVAQAQAVLADTLQVEADVAQARDRLRRGLRRSSPDVTSPAYVDLRA